VDEISIDTRSTFHEQWQEGVYDSHFQGDYFNLHILGHLTDNLSFRVRQRFNKKIDEDNPFNATDFLWLKWQASPKWSFTAGKHPIMVGAYEMDSAPIDVYYYGTFSNCIYQYYAFGASDVTYPYANAYITIYLLGSLFVMVGLGMNSYINAQGFARIGMLSVLIGAVCNLLLDPLFIFAFHMGVRGAALATIISQGISAAWVLSFLTGKHAILRLRPRNMKPDLKIIGRISGLGLTGFTMALTNSVVQIALNSSLQTLGGDLYVGIMTVIHSIREIITLPVSGITTGSQAVLGYNYGAKRHDRVREGIRFMFWVGFLYSVGVWLLVNLIPNTFIRIFNQDPDLLLIGPHCMRLYYMGFFLMAFQFVGQSVFVALGKAKQAVFFSLFRKVFVVVPMVLLLPHLFNLGVDGVFLAEPISDLLGGGACFLTMMLTVYRRLSSEAPASKPSDPENP